MAATRNRTSPPVDQDLVYQRREWRFERVGWSLMGLTIALALAGLFGTGPLSRTAASDDAGRLRLEYDRFLRHHTPSTLSARLDGEATAGGEVRVWLGREFLEGVELTQVTPEPLRVEAAADRHVFVFRVAEPGRPAAILFRFEPEGPGLLSGTAGVDGGSPVGFRQLVYP